MEQSIAFFEPRLPREPKTIDSKDGSGNNRTIHLLWALLQALCYIAFQTV